MRCSLKWGYAKILPTGYSEKINYKGIEYYKNVISEILKYNMTPAVTIYHWDLPQTLVDIGWTNPEIIDIFVDYARIVIKSFPEVGLWITINEPKQICHYGYGRTIFSPALNSSGLGEYQCAYFLLKAHAKTYRMYKTEFPDYKAKMTITIDCEWYDPLSNSTSDKEAAERLRQFEFGIYAHPIYIGDWPIDVKLRIYERSMIENLNKTRLPEFTLEEISYIKGTTDVFALNYYYACVVNDLPEAGPDVISYDSDVRLHKIPVPNAKSVFNGCSVAPWGLGNILKYIQNTYNDPEILITELGISDSDAHLEDDSRIDFYNDHFKVILTAMYKYGVKIRGLIAWSLLDNFEWDQGYSVRMGFYHVDFNNPNRTRAPKKSASYFKEVIQTKRLPIKSGNNSGSVFYSLDNYLLALISIIMGVDF